MKYIKLFIENLNNEYYQEISEDIYYECNNIVFNTDDANRIIDLFRMHKIYVYNYQSWDLIKNTNDNLNDTVVIRIDIYHTVVKILSLVDEWFIVSIYNRGKTHVYKCDQMDGLIKCLKDKNLI